jgi:hypothetical protein
MGLLDWIRRLGRPSAEPEEEAEVASAAPIEAAPEPRKLPKPPKPPKPPQAREPKPRKKKNRKKRKNLHQDPRLRKPTPPPRPPEPVTAPLAEPEVIAPEVIAPVVEPVVEPVAEPEVARPISVARHRAGTRDWIVAEKMAEVIGELDGILAQEGAPRGVLLSTRSRLEREWRALMPLPEGEEQLSADYDARIATLSQRIAALPDPREVEEQASIAARRALIAQAQALAGEEDVQAAIRRARELQQSWQRSARVPREHAALSAQWRAAMDALYARRDADRDERLGKLEGLVAQAELLAGSNDPARAAEAMKGLQARWKSTGSPRGEAADALWKRFRAAADQIFSARRAAKDAEEQANLAARQALIAEAEARAAEGVEDAEELIARLHQRWRRIGHVPRALSDAQWTAFRRACDQLRSTPQIDPALLGDGGDTLRFSPFAVLGEE